MAGELAGIDVYWQIDTGSGFVTLGAESSSNNTFNASLIDISNKGDDNGTEDRELLANSGLLSRDLTVELVSSNSAGLDSAVKAENTIVNVREIRNAVAQASFKAKVVSVVINSGEGDVDKYTITFNSTEAV